MHHFARGIKHLDSNLEMKISNVFPVVIYLVYSIHFSESCLTDSYEFLKKGEKVPYGNTGCDLIINSFPI